MKMKKIILFLFNVAILCNLQAQIEYDQGTIWYYGFVSHETSPIHMYIFQSLTIDGDTIIDGQSFQKIVKSNDSYLFDLQTPFSVEYIRKENDKVFWFNQDNGSVSILYNFAAEQGDSWTILINDCELLITVDSVNYSEYNGTTKKNIYVNDYFTDLEGRVYVGHCFKGKIIEDIGHTATYFPFNAYYLCNGIQIDGVSLDNIRCYKDNNSYYNFKEYPCDSIWNEFVGINDYANNIKIYPNPAKDIIYIKDIDKLDVISILLINIYGQIIKQYGSNTTQLDISDIISGIYFVKISTSKGNIIQKLSINQ